MEILVEKCPSYDEPLAQCPLAVLRREPGIAERRRKLSQLSDADVAEFYRQHLACVCKVCGTAA